MSPLLRAALPLLGALLLRCAESLPDTRGDARAASPPLSDSSSAADTSTPRLGPLADGALPAPEAGASADASSAWDAPAPLGPVLQAEVRMECRLGGVQFTVVPTTPFRGPEGYTFTWLPRAGRGTYSATGNSLVTRNNATGDQSHFDVRVERPGYPALVLEDLWSYPCNVGDNPTECPENLREVVTNQENYAVGDTFVAVVAPSDAPFGMGWYSTEGLAEVVLSDQGRRLTARVASFPIHTHAQPNNNNGSGGPTLCHGWTDRYFFRADASPPPADASAPPGDASAPPADSSTPAVDASAPPVADRIQVELRQECRLGGVQFTVLPTSPYATTEGYSFRWSLRQGSAPFHQVAPNSMVAENTVAGAGFPMHFDVVVSHPGYPDQTIPDVWSNPCAHDDNPLDCPENTRPIVTNQASYRVGDTLEAQLVGAPPGATWYLQEGLGATVVSDEGRHLSGVVLSLPVHLHDQPPSMPGAAVCHGWTERWFF